MNKLVKGSIAGAAGIALLLGGAGTLAYWNDNATLADAGTVTAGQLDIDSTTDGDWSADITNIVPGDIVTYTEGFTVTAVGDNLKFKIESTIPSIVSTIPGATVDSNYVVKNGAAIVAPVAGEYTNLAAGTYTVDATITVTFPTTVTGQVGQLATQDLGTATITVTQIP